MLEQGTNKTQNKHFAQGNLEKQTQDEPCAQGIPEK